MALTTRCSGGVMEARPGWSRLRGGDETMERASVDDFGEEEVKGEGSASG